MENYKSELTSLKEELNSRIDAVIAKIEKPKFEVGKWYNNESNTFLFCYQGETSYGFGNADNYEIDLETASLSPRFYHLATPKEAEEALNKYAEIIYKECKRVKPLWETPKESWVFTEQENSRLFQGCFFYKNICVMKDGIWATPIKTKTIDELAEKYRQTVNNWFHKQTFNQEQIIEIYNLFNK